ncbi:MAG: hypothetical protein E7180_03445 [Erysipelotrichaceae bacterium]|nr:hypothetical protein [Erysipelotrichaceae bacterium]
MKLINFASILTSGIILLSSMQESGSTFKYTYQIKGNSYSPKDSVNLYYYKEKLIDKYEDLVFTLKEDYVGEFIKTNIHEFDFDKKCKAKYINGTILLIVGEGKGSLIEGKLRINSCDDSVIREKIYLLDIFK